MPLENPYSTTFSEFLNSAVQGQTQAQYKTLEEYLNAQSKVHKPKEKGEYYQLGRGKDQGFFWPVLPNKYTLGLDVEFILRDKITNLPKSAIGIIPGTKANPHRVSRGTLQADGVLLEIGIDPVDNYFDFEKNISTVLTEAKRFANRANCYISDSIEAEYPEHEVMSTEAWEAGCSPFWNCWTGEEYPKVEFDSLLRTCGGHIHIGFKEIEKVKADFKDHLAMVCEAYVGFPVSDMEPKTRRREVYGKPGAFRYKPYGVEIRTPSNFWIFNKLTRKFVFCRIKDALSHFMHTGKDCLPDSPLVISSIIKNALAGNKASRNKFKGLSSTVFYEDFKKEEINYLKYLRGNKSQKGLNAHQQAVYDMLMDFEAEFQPTSIDDVTILNK